MFDWFFNWRSQERIDKILESNQKPPEWKTYTYDPDLSTLTRERNLAVSALKTIARNEENFSKESLMQLANNILQEMVK